MDVDYDDEVAEDHGHPPSKVTGLLLVTVVEVAVRIVVASSSCSSSSSSSRSPTASYNHTVVYMGIHFEGPLRGLAFFVSFSSFSSSSLLV